ncbi:MAG: hypothetical protein U0797_24360 [Gemmataceae bacterium]
MARHGERGWALCGLLVALLTGEASAAAPPTMTGPPLVRNVWIDVMVAHTERGEFTGGHLRRADLRALRRRVGRGVNEGIVQVLAEVRLVTLGGNLACLFIGDDRADGYRDVLGGAGLRFEGVGTHVSAIPTVLHDGEARLEFEVESSQLRPKDGRRSTQRIHTTGEMKPGEGHLIVLHVPSDTDKEAGYDLVVLCKPMLVRPPQEGETPRE